MGRHILKPLSPAALQLILDVEVGGGQSYYERCLARPSWPGGQSGVTIGIGYDLGYTPEARFLADWPGGFNSSERRRLCAVIGRKGEIAKEFISGLADIWIPWAAARAVFVDCTIPFWVEETIKAFPGAENLPADAFGALVSLVFNRGPSMTGERRTEMRWIRTAVAQDDLPGIAKSLRAMKRLWVGKGLDGLLARREAEAKLVEGAV